MIILAIYLVNVISFLLMSLLLRTRFTSAELMRERGCLGSYSTMNYFIAGTLNQPETAFEFIMGDISDNEGITLMQFRRTGWNAKETAKTILRDISEYHFKSVRIFTISVGDHVGRYLDQALANNPHIAVDIVAINPCPTPQCLRADLQEAIKWAPILQVIKYALGWFSVLPVIPTSGGMYSLGLLLDQLLQVWRMDTPYAMDCTMGVILSARDKLLNNDRVGVHFAKARKEWVDCNHGNTGMNAENNEYGPLYREKVLELIRYCKKP